MFAGVPDHVDEASGLPTLQTAIFLLVIGMRRKAKIQRALPYLSK